MLRRGADRAEPAQTRCSPECLNARLPRVPTEAEVAAMRHGALLGWDSPGADPKFWATRRNREP